MRGGVTIGSHFEICFGLKTGDDEKFLHHTKGLHPDDKRLLRGDDVKRYESKYKGELVHPGDQIEPDASREALIEITVDSLILFLSLIVIDDVDSLESQCQNDGFQTLVQIMNRTKIPNRPFSRVRFIARLSLDAAPGQLIQVLGLDQSEFAQFATVTSERIGVPCACSKRQLDSLPIIPIHVGEKIVA